MSKKEAHPIPFMMASQVRVLRDLTRDKAIKPRTVASREEAIRSGLPIGTDYFMVRYNGKDLYLAVPAS